MRLGNTPKRPEDGGVAEVDLHLHELVQDETRFKARRNCAINWPTSSGR
ncbi:MAG: hypothetical protein IPH63_05390 [Flavobacteriales bacterium]|nr:hypothetical protein [Flavobacteriales bacterium]